MIVFSKFVDILLVTLVVGKRDIFLGRLGRTSFSPAIAWPYKDEFTAENLKIIATKAKEMREYGINPQLCTECNGTPYFPLNNCLSERHLEFY